MADVTESGTEGFQNPFDLPDRPIGDFRPLCPWQTTPHEALYAPVDHTAEAFLRFRNSTGGGAEKWAQTVIACGREGSGKTSLLHRCATQAQRYLQQTDVSAYILDLTGEQIPGIESAAQLEHICARLIDQVGVRNVLPAAAQEQLAAKRREPFQAFPFLADVVDQGRAPSHLLVLLPPIELVDELHRYAALARPRLTLFTESTDSAVRAEAIALEERGAQSVVCLELAALGVEDGWKLVDARIAASPGRRVPSITKQTMDRFMDARIGGQGATSIRELEAVCAAVFEDAIRRAASTIAYEDFQEYYVRKAVLP